MNVFERFHFTADNFGRDPIPQNAEEILSWLNRRMDKLLAYDGMFQERFGFLDYELLTYDGREALRDLWENYWNDMFQTAPKAKY